MLTPDELVLARLSILFEDSISSQLLQNVQCSTLIWNKLTDAHVAHFPRSQAALEQRRNSKPLSSSRHTGPMPVKTVTDEADEPVKSLLEEMQQCKSVKDCIELALTDAYGEYEEAGAWLTCIEEMFGRFDRVKLMGQEVALDGFDLKNDVAVVAICRRGKRRARVALESVEFPNLTPIEARWLKAWKQFSQGLG